MRRVVLTVLDLLLVDLNGRLQCDQKEIQNRENNSSHSRTPLSSSYNFRATATTNQEMAGALVTAGAELVRRFNALPFRRGLRRAPAQIANRRRRERDAAVDAQPVFRSHLQQSTFDLDMRRCLRGANPACQ